MATVPYDLCASLSCISLLGWWGQQFGALLLLIKLWPCCRQEVNLKKKKKKKKLNCCCFNLSHFFRDDDDEADDDEESIEEESPVKASRYLYRGVLNWSLIYTCSLCNWQLPICYRPRRLQPNLHHPNRRHPNPKHLHRMARVQNRTLQPKTRWQWFTWARMASKGKYNI